MYSQYGRLSEFSLDFSAIWNIDTWLCIWVDVIKIRTPWLSDPIVKPVVAFKVIETLVAYHRSAIERGLCIVLFWLFQAKLTHWSALNFLVKFDLCFCRFCWGNSWYDRAVDVGSQKLCCSLSLSLFFFWRLEFLVECI